jgi:hypothetical protein
MGMVCSRRERSAEGNWRRMRCAVVVREAITAESQLTAVLLNMLFQSVITARAASARSRTITQFFWALHRGIPCLGFRYLVLITTRLTGMSYLPNVFLDISDSLEHHHVMYPQLVIYHLARKRRRRKTRETRLGVTW